MLDYTGASSYSLGETAAEKRRTDGNLASKTASALNNTSPFQFNKAPQGDYSTFQASQAKARQGVDAQFQNSLTPPRRDLPGQTGQTVTPIGLLPGVMMQLANANLERLAGQVLGFFSANRRAITEEERLNRNLNDAFGEGLLGEVIKVEAPHKGQMEDGEDG